MWFYIFWTLLIWYPSSVFIQNFSFLIFYIVPVLLKLQPLPNNFFSLGDFVLDGSFGWLVLSVHRDYTAPSCQTLPWNSCTQELECAKTLPLSAPVLSGKNLLEFWSSPPFRSFRFPFASFLSLQWMLWIAVL